MRTINGILAVALAIFSLLPSIVPGAMPTLGFLISLGALVSAILSVSTDKRNYYKFTLIIVSVGVLLITDGLRLWEPLPMSISYKVTLYSIFSVAVWVSVMVVSELSKNRETV